jgi:alpha-beta hydrolase superfamily lysophospholipase
MAATVPSSRRLTRRLAGGITALLVVAWVGPAAVASYNVVHPERRAHSEAPGLGEAVAIPGADGITLAGRWKAATRPIGTVVLLHGYGRDKSQMLSAAHFLHQAHFHTLAYDARAHGQSTGTQSTVGAREQADLKKVLDWLGTRGITDRIGALGFSMGGATAIMTAADEPRLQAVATEGCFSTLDTLLGVAFPVFFHLPSLPYAPLAVRFCEWQAGFAAADLRPVEAIGRLGNRPVFVMGGMADRIATPAQTLALAHGALRAQLWLIPDARHVQGFSKHPGEYRLRVTAFFQTALASALATLPVMQVAGH